MPNSCTCPDCGSEHPVSRPPREELDNYQRVKLFRDTYLHYKVVRELLDKSIGAFDPDNYAQLAVRQLHIAILRKYLLDDRDNVNLNHVVKACLEILPKKYAEGGILEIIQSNVRSLNSGELQGGIQFFHGDEIDRRSVHEVVVDYLYGLLLHGDYAKAQRSINGGPLNTLLSSSNWMAFANRLVVEVSILVERTIGFIDRGDEFLEGLPPLEFSDLKG